MLEGREFVLRNNLSGPAYAANFAKPPWLRRPDRIRFLLEQRPKKACEGMTGTSL